MAARILATALPVFTALFLGILCRRASVLDRSGVDSLKKIAVNITLPIMVFPSFASADYSPERLMIPVVIFLTCLSALGLGYVFKRVFRQKSRLMPFLMTGFESGMLGYSLFALLYPNEPSSLYAIVDLANGLFVFTVFKGLLMGKGKGKELIRSAFASPVLWSILIGVFCGATGLWRSPALSGAVGVIGSVCSFVGAPTSCLILLTIGYDLHFGSINWKNTAAYTAMRLVIMGAALLLLLAVNRRLLGGMIHEGALMLMLMTPAPFVLPIFADVEGERADISSTLSVMTLVTLLIFPLLAVIT